MGSSMLPKRCFCMKLRYGNILWVSGSAISSLLFTLLIAARLFLEDVEVTQAETIIGYIGMAVCGVEFISSVVLLYALQQKKPLLFIPWLVGNVLYLVFCPVVVVVIFFVNSKIDNYHKHYLDILLAIFAGLNVIPFILAEICVLSYFLQLAKIKAKENLALGKSAVPMNDILPHRSRQQPRHLPPIAEHPSHSIATVGAATATHGAQFPAVHSIATKNGPIHGPLATKSIHGPAPHSLATNGANSPAVYSIATKTPAPHSIATKGGHSNSHFLQMSPGGSAVY